MLDPPYLGDFLRVYFLTLEVEQLGQLHLLAVSLRGLKAENLHLPILLAGNHHVGEAVVKELTALHSRVRPVEAGDHGSISESGSTFPLLARFLLLLHSCTLLWDVGPQLAVRVCQRVH